MLVSTTRPHTVLSGISRFSERKMHSRGKKYRFSPSSFSPPFAFRLPCRTVGLSCRRLQHQLSRQAGAAHFKVRNRLPGPDSCIKNNSVLSHWKKYQTDVEASLVHCSHSEFNMLHSCLGWIFFCHSLATFNPSFPTSRSCSYTARTLSKTRNLEPTPRGIGASEVTDLPPQ